MFPRLPARYHTTDDGAPQGGAAGDDVRAAFQRRIDKANGDAQAFAWELYRDNYELRRERDGLRGRVPVEGAVVLTSDDAGRWAAYRELGAPDALATALAEGATAKQQTAQLERRAAVRSAADAAGYKAPVLERLIGDLALSVADGKAIVTTAAGPVELTAYAAQAWPDFLPALTTTPAPAAGVAFPVGSGGHAPATPVGAAQAHITARYAPPKTA